MYNGKKLDLAKPFAFVDSFFEKSLSEALETFIVSHKTLHPFRGDKYNLHESAKKWLANQSFYNEKIPTYFELTLEKKLNRIKSLNCDFFIDDLPELLKEKNFPINTKKILFDPNNLHKDSSEYLRFSSWKNLCTFFYESYE